MKEITLSPHGARNWRCACGSFVRNGHRGSDNDWMLEMFILCSTIEAEPTRIVMSSDVFQSFLKAEGLQVRYLGEQVHKATLEILVSPVVTREEAEELRRTTDRLLAELTKRALDYHGATIERDIELEPGTMLFYIGAQLVGETMQWLN